MPSWQTYLVKTTMRRLKKRVTTLVDDLPRLRAEKEYLLGKLWLPSGIKRNPFQLNHLESEWFVPDGTLLHDRKIILYLHGGGYAIGSIKSYRSLIAKLARETRLKTLAINYRLAPEHPFPAALDDALHTYLWLLEYEGYQPEDIILAGDSAGGGLAAALLLALREMELPMPMAGILLSPWTDLAGTGRSIRTKADDDPILPACKLKSWGKQYAHITDVKHPFVSPLYGDLSGLPPMFVQVGTEEVVHDDSTRFAAKAKECGSPIEIEIWKDMPHVWHFCWHVLPEARRAFENIAGFVREQVQDSQDIYRHRPKASILRHAYEAGRLSAAILSTAVVRGAL